MQDVFEKALWHLKNPVIRLANRGNRRDGSLWVFGEWFGAICGDNCAAFANYAAARHPGLTLCWIAKPGADTSVLHPAVRVIPYGSAEAVRALKRAGYVFVGQNFRDFTPAGFHYAAGAVTVLLWHGIPWKKIGYDASKHSGRLPRAWRRFEHRFCGYSRYLSASPRYDRVLATAYLADETQLLRAGMPRGDALCDATYTDSCRRELLRRLQLGGDAVILTYMPTFRADRGEQQDMEELFRDEAFARFLAERHAVIVVKSHFAADSGLTAMRGGSGRVFYLNDVSAQTLLAATDLLITDYSSCFFDFLRLDRPVVHFLYDYEAYRDRDRGLYYPKEEVTAGSEAADFRQLRQAIRDNLAHPARFAERRQRIRRAFMTYDSCHNCENIYRQLTEGGRRP